MSFTETRPEDARAVDLLVQLRARGARTLAAKLSGRIGSENEGALLGAIHEAEAYIAAAGGKAMGAGKMGDRMRTMADEMMSGNADPKAMAARMRAMADEMDSMMGSAKG